MADKTRIICRRCLLEETGEAELLHSLEELKEALPAEEKANETEYSARLKKCRACGSLENGTCRKCGCYVEFRALKKRQHCPAAEPEW